MSECARCRSSACDKGEAKRYPAGCPSLDEEQSELRRYYEKPDDRHLARNAAVVEAEGYCRLTRVEETMAFARHCGFRRLGIAFCIGLRKEAAVLDRVLRANGFEVESIACKSGSHPKELLGIEESAKVHPDSFEAMCNPVGQARLLDKAGTELNLVLGLCVGHDSLFFRHSTAPVTVIATKDRVLGHNPLAALYLADSYYRGKLFPETPPAEPSER